MFHAQDSGKAGQIDHAVEVIVMSQKTGRFLLQTAYPNQHWTTIQRDIEPDSNPERASMDALFNATGFEDTVRFVALDQHYAPEQRIHCHKFLAVIDDEFGPWKLQDNHQAQWFDLQGCVNALGSEGPNILSDDRSMSVIHETITRIRKGENLLEHCEPAERTLYHCLYKEPEGDALLPTCRRFENGREDDFLFATPYLSKALAFSFSYHVGNGIVENGPIYGSPEEFAIVCNRNKTMIEPRPAAIYSFSSLGFESLPPGARQYVSTAAVPFNEARLEYQTNDVSEIMRKGLQIFSVECTLKEFYEPNGLDEQYGLLSNSEMLYRMVSDGHAIWENRDRNVGVSTALIKTFEVLKNREATKTFPSAPRPI